AGYNEPSNPDVVINNYGEVTPERAASEIVRTYLSGAGLVGGDKGKGAYWDSVYSEKTGVLEPSPFSEFVSRVLGKEKRSFLEVGCGNGRDAIHFDNIGFDVTAIDTSVTAIALCHKLHKGNGARFLATGISALGLSEPNVTYDVIYSRFVLHVMTTPEEAEFLTNSYQMLGDGGALFIECRSINDPLARKGEIISPTERIFGHYRRFIVLDELTAGLESVGFILEQIIERKGLAVFGEEDPVIIRVVARSKHARAFGQ
ncbi:MAG: class I SAM-dependent methyltransferase, partial [Nitrososphaera sp.]